MTKRRRMSKYSYTFSFSSLIADLPVVAALRVARIARGGSDGAAEAKLMVSEKVAATRDFLAALLSGRLGKDPRRIAAVAWTEIGRKVHANRTRLEG